MGQIKFISCIAGQILILFHKLLQITFKGVYMSWDWYDNL